MYTPDNFKISDLSTLQADMERWNFATLVTPDAGRSTQITHLPLLLNRQGGRFGVLTGHMAKANTHWRAFGGLNESVAIFHGPHAYISPRWYESQVAVPTWNYVVVHAHGKPRLLQGTEGMERHLQELVRRHEGTGLESWQPDRMPTEIFASLLEGIVYFEIPITRIEGKAKLGQNRPQADTLGVIIGLQETDTAGNRELIEMTKARAIRPCE